MGVFATELQALMQARGISGAALARLAHCDPALICRYKKGTQQPSAMMALQIDEILGAGGELAMLAGPDRRSVLASGIVAGALLGADAAGRLVRHQPAVDPAAIAALAAVLASQRRADDAFGSAVMMQPVAAQVTAVRSLVRQATGPLRPALVDVAQQWTQFSAYQHRQAGKYPADRALLAETLELATEIGDRTMIATVLLNRGETALLAGEAGTVVGLAQAVQQDRHAAPGPRAHAADLEARGHAVAGETQAAERCLDTAADLGAHLPDSDDRHPWLHWMSPTDMLCKRGVSYGYLAADDRCYDRAVAGLEAGYAALPAAQRDTPWGAKYPAHLAVVHARHGDIGQACASALQAAEITRRTGPSLADRLVRQVHKDLRKRAPRDSRVADLTAALT